MRTLCAGRRRARCARGRDRGRRGAGARHVELSARGAVRRYADLDALVQEVATARIHDGVHYRFSTEAGTDLGKRVGALAVQRFAGP